MTGEQRVALAQRLAEQLDDLPDNELGKVVQLTRRIGLVDTKRVMEALASDGDHFIRSGQTQRYAGVIAKKALAMLISERVDDGEAARVLGWTRKLLGWRNRLQAGGSEGAVVFGNVRPTPRINPLPTTPRGRRRSG